MIERNIDWKAVLAEGVFWRSYYAWEDFNEEATVLWLKQLGLFKHYDPDEEDPDIDGLPTNLGFTVPLGDGFGLMWSFYTPYGAAGHDLYLVHPVAGEVKIGWNDSHFHLDTFRWHERDVLIERAHKHWPGLFDFHRFPPLLSMYIGSIPQDSTPEKERLLDSEFRQLGVFEDEEISRLIDGTLNCRENASWEYEPTRGWVFSGGYSSRDAQLGDPLVFRAIQDCFRGTEDM